MQHFSLLCRKLIVSTTLIYAAFDKINAVSNVHLPFFHVTQNFNIKAHTQVRSYKWKLIRRASPMRQKFLLLACTVIILGFQQSSRQYENCTQQQLENVGYLRPWAYHTVPHILGKQFWALPGKHFSLIKDTLDTSMLLSMTVDQC